MNRGEYFNVYSCCIPVKGKKRATICDLQRDRFHFIPIVLYEILNRFIKRGISISEIKKYFDHQQDQLIDEYFHFLENEEYGFFSETFWNLPPINLNKYYDPKPINNAIVDFAPESKHTLEQIIPQLSELICESLEIRFFYSIPIEQLYKILEQTDGSTLREVEVLMRYNEDYSLENIVTLRVHFARLRKITLHNAPYNRFIENEEITIIYTQKQIQDETCCGVVNHWYFISKTEVFIESKHRNSCLNKKISIDTQGNIKNCPSMKKSFGNISDNRITDVIKQPDFTQLWFITKDSIEVCRDCEFRYICQDCRAYLSDENNLLSKPLKCTYTPYE